MQFHAAVGSNRLDEAMAFYGALPGSIGWGHLFDNPGRGRFYGTISDGVFAVVRPFDGGPAKAGNGSMAGFGFASRAKVGAVHAKALSLGGTDEGAPGDRGGGACFACCRI